MKVIELNNDNFEFVAARYYLNPECFAKEEFEEDLNRFKYIKRILRKYKRTNDIDDRSIRLALNHIILITNMWGVQPGTSFLFFKLEKELHSMLKTILLYLHSLPKDVNGINTLTIEVDRKLAEKLRSI